MEGQCNKLEQRDCSRVKPKGKVCIRKYNPKVQLNIKYNIVKRIDHLNLNVAKLDYHTGGKWLVYDTKHRKENPFQCLKHSCKLSLGENIHQTKKSIYSSIGYIIRNCKSVGQQKKKKKKSQGSVSTVKTAIY